MLRTRGVQLDFKAAPKAPPPPDWLEKFFEFLVGLGPVFRFLFWSGLVLAGVLIAWYVAREVMAWRKPVGTSAPAADWRPEPAAARALLEEADRLAQGGG